jgi:hypothetical protein
MRKKAGKDRNRTMAPTGLHPPSNRGEARQAANEVERESERDTTANYTVPQTPPNPNPKPNHVDSFSRYSSRSHGLVWAPFSRKIKNMDGSDVIRHMTDQYCLRWQAIVISMGVHTWS